MHQVKGSGLNKLITNYNTTQANQPTPAGQALINAGLLSTTDLQALNGVQQPIATVPGNPLSNSAFRAFDTNVAYPIHLSKVREGLTITPTFAMYNVANMSNFGRLTGQLINQADNGGPVGATNNFLNGPDNNLVANGIRTQRGSGTFAQGSPRTSEFQLHIEF